MPDLTVVIPSHGKRPLLERTLQALAAQDLPPERWNVVVVDDASPDDTAAFLEKAVGAWDGRLRSVAPPHNVGRARARNLGAAEADGDWILFLDDDVVAPPGLLQAHLDLLGGDRTAGTIGLVRTAPELVDAPHFEYIDTRGAAKISGPDVPPRYLVTQNTSVPREAFVRIGGFDEAFLAYGFEDTDLGYRLADAGVRFLLLTDPVPHHVHHHTFAAWIAKKRECGHGPLQRIAAKHPDRIADLGLGWILDPPGTVAPPHLALLRLLLRRLAGPVLRPLLTAWPGADDRAAVFPLYARLMDLLVVSSFCQGLSDPVSQPSDS